MEEEEEEEEEEEDDDDDDDDDDEEEEETQILGPYQCLHRCLSQALLPAIFIRWYEQRNEHCFMFLYFSGYIPTEGSVYLVTSRVPKGSPCSESLVLEGRVFKGPDLLSDSVRRSDQLPTGNQWSRPMKSRIL